MEIKFMLINKKVVNLNIINLFEILLKLFVGIGIVKELTKTFPNDTLDEILEWLKEAGCSVGPIVCEILFKSEKLCDKAFNLLCNKM